MEEEKIYIKSAYKNEELVYSEKLQTNSFDAFNQRYSFGVDIFGSIMNRFMDKLLDMLMKIVDDNPRCFPERYVGKSLEDLAEIFVGMKFDRPYLDGIARGTTFEKNSVIYKDFSSFYNYIPMMKTPSIELAMATWVYNDLKNIEFQAPSNWRDIVPPFGMNGDTRETTGEIKEEDVTSFLDTLKSIINPNVEIDVVDCLISKEIQIEYYKRSQIILRNFLKTEYYLDMMLLNPKIITDRHKKKSFQVLKELTLYSMHGNQMNYEAVTIGNILYGYVEGDVESLFQYVQMCSMYLKLIGDTFKRVTDKLVGVFEGTLDSSKITFVF